MPPRRGRGRGKAATPSKADNPPQAEEATAITEPEEVVNSNGDPTENADSEAMEQGTETTGSATQENGKSNNTETAEQKPPEDDIKYPYQIKVTRLPTTTSVQNLQQYVATTFKVLVPKVSLLDTNTLAMLYFSEKEPMESLARLLDNHIWRKKKLLAEPWLPLESKKRKRDDDEDDEEQEKKKNKVEENDEPLSLTEEFLAESMPLMKVSYDQQKRISQQDAAIMSTRLHGLICERNPALAGWAEKAFDDNGGTIFPIDDVRSYPSLVGFRNKCKFRIGKNNEGETIVGFVLNDNENKILEVEPGDSLVHLPDIMKLAAKKLQEFVRTSDNECYDKKKKTGLWESLRVRIAPDGRLMLVVVVSPRGLTDATLEKAKTDVKEFFTNGAGKDSNIMSLYLHVAPLNPNVAYTNEKLFHLDGATDMVETICGIKFHVSPQCILNIYPYTLETMYRTVEELAQPTADSVVIDACAGSCGVALLLSKKCEKAYAIELQKQNIEDAEKSKLLNNIDNVEIIHGKVEEKIQAILEANKEKPIIIVLDPPRHGIDSKVISQIRAQPNVKRIIFLCCDTNTEIKNIVELAAAEGKDSKTGLQMEGLPFLPLRVVPIDVAPFTVINTLVFIFERVDPSTYPAATRPIPPISQTDLRKKQPPQDKRNRDNRKSGRGGRFNTPPSNVKARGPPVRGPPPRRGGGPGSSRYVDASVISKYERRIAELEDQQRAYKAGLAMGMQAFNRSGSGGGNSPWMSQARGGYSDSEYGGDPGYGSGYSNDTWGNPAWQSSPQMGNTGGWGGNSGGPWAGGFGGNQGGYGNQSRQSNYQRNSGGRNSGGGRNNSGNWGSGRGGGNRR